MTVSSVRNALIAAKRDGKVDAKEIDQIMLKAADGGGLDEAERAELMKAADGFDDTAKQRLLSHLSAMGQKNAWVNIEAPGKVASIEGRYANMTLNVPGLSAKVGMFDNAFSMVGSAAMDGTLKLMLDGKPVQVAVKRGEPAPIILEHLQKQLPPGFAGVLLGGDVQPYDPALFSGKAPRRGEQAAHLMLYKPEALGLEPGEKPMRVVVTGYGKFMGITDNPSANMAQKLAEQGIKGAIVEYRRLDVTPEAVDSFLAEMKKSPPDVILSMGVTGGQAQVEERPENHLGANEDGNGRMMTERDIIPGAPKELNTDLPVKAIDWAEQQFGANRATFTSLSDTNYQPDRSQYLCNYLGFSLASAFGKSDSTIAGFMHITKDTPVEQMHVALEAVASTQLEWRRTHGPNAPRS